MELNTASHKEVPFHSISVFISSFSIVNAVYLSLNVLLFATTLEFYHIGFFVG